MLGLKARMRQVVQVLEPRESQILPLSEAV